MYHGLGAHYNDFMEEWQPLTELEQVLDRYGVDTGVKKLRSWLERDPHPLGWYNLGILEKRRGRLLDALEAFERAADLAPDKPEIWNEIGLVYDEQGRLSAAEEHYRKAVELDPEFARAWNNWGVTAFMRGDLSTAKVRFERATELDAESESAWFNLRDVCNQIGDLAGAERAQAMIDEIGVDEDDA